MERGVRWSASVTNACPLLRRIVPATKRNFATQLALLPFHEQPEPGATYWERRHLFLCAPYHRQLDVVYHRVQVPLHDSSAWSTWSSYDPLSAVAVPSCLDALSLCTPAVATLPPADSPGCVHQYVGLLLLRSPNLFLADWERERLAGRGGGIPSIVVALEWRGA
ncbi:hypothetical protein R3P38DRAFT_3222030 [Favolaschia claudopus]|uniref:Uncharacterized protein n=1 Tax=Favolaschia claudopus TaxID=2862362 RepID=A0AAV9ZYW4_9AGAR